LVLRSAAPTFPFFFWNSRNIVSSSFQAKGKTSQPCFGNTPPLVEREGFGDVRWLFLEIFKDWELSVGDQREN
jgi:hypothetical protein